MTDDGQPIPRHPAAGLPYGFYATPNPTNPGQITLWEVRDTLGKDFLPWPRRSKYHPDGLSSTEYGQWLTQVVQAITADPSRAQWLFAKQAIRCWVCGRRLTTKRSRADGIGPECRSRPPAAS